MVSIIIPVYNSECFLRKCLSSVQSQSYSDIEVLCIDDGSTDNSNEIIEEYVSIDKRFRHISKKHTNAGETRNVGIEASTGKYLMFLDSDDFFAPNMVELALETALNSDADIAIFQYKLYYEKAERISSHTYGIHTNRRKPFKLIDVLNNRFEITNIAVWNKLYRADFVKSCNIKFKSHAAINDVFFSWCSLVLADKIALCRNVGTFYRVGIGSSISDNLLRTSCCFVDAFLEVNEYLQMTEVWGQIREDLYNAELKQFCEFYSKLKKECDLQECASSFYNKMQVFFKRLEA